MTDVPDKSNLLEDGGVFIASKHQIVSKKATAFNTRGSSTDSFANKGFVEATIDYQGQRVHVFGTHLDAGDDLTRVRQMGEIKAAMAPYLNNNRQPVFLSGDLNIKNRSDRYFSTFLKNGTGAGDLQGFVDGSYTKASIPNTYDPDKQILDYVLVNPNGAILNKFKTEIRSNKFGVGNLDYTDHNTVASELEFLKSNGVAGGGTVFHRSVQVAKSNGNGALIDTVTPPSINFVSVVNNFFDPSTPLEGNVTRFDSNTRLNIELYTRIFDPSNGSTTKDLNLVAPQIFRLPNNIANTVKALGGRVEVYGGAGNDTLLGGAWKTLWMGVLAMIL